MTFSGGLKMQHWLKLVKHKYSQNQSSKIENNQDSAIFGGHTRNISEAYPGTLVNKKDGELNNTN